jgi:phosphopentomutase
MKYLLMGILSLYSHFGYSQVYKFKAIDAYLEQYDENGKDTTTGEWEKSGVLIVVDFTKNKIKTFGQTPQDYDLLYLENKLTDLQGNIKYIYPAVDAEGVKCEVQLVIFKQKIHSPNIANLAFHYSKMSLVLRLKKDE